MSGSHARTIPVQPTGPLSEAAPAPTADAHPVDVHRDVAELRRLIEQARTMPMSSSCVVNRAEVLEHLDQLDRNLTQALAHASQVGAQRDEIVRRAHDEADLIVSRAESNRDDLVSDSEVFRLASSRAEQLVGEAAEEARMLRRDADDYVEGRLAALETSLQATLEAVTRGRSRLRGRNPLEELGRDSSDGAGDDD